jgi:hypothetical protein
MAEQFCTDLNLHLSRFYHTNYPSSWSNPLNHRLTGELPRLEFHLIAV